MIVHSIKYVFTKYVATSVGVQCSPLPEVQNGEYNEARCDNPAELRKYEDLCKVTCNTGYFISEEVEWRCLSSRMWSNIAKTVNCTCMYV